MRHVIVTDNCRTHVNPVENILRASNSQTRSESFPGAGAGKFPWRRTRSPLNELRRAIETGFFSKLTLKNQMDDLLDRLREFHQGKRKITPADLRRSFDLLIMKVLSLVQDADKKLASDILSSRDALWGLLVDPVTFATLDV